MHARPESKELALIIKALLRNAQNLGVEQAFKACIEATLCFLVILSEARRSPATKRAVEGPWFSAGVDYESS